MTTKPIAEEAEAFIDMLLVRFLDISPNVLFKGPLREQLRNTLIDAYMQGNKDGYDGLITILKNKASFETIHPPIAEETNTMAIQHAVKLMSPVEPIHDARLRILSGTVGQVEEDFNIWASDLPTVDVHWETLSVSWITEFNEIRLTVFYTEPRT